MQRIFLSLASCSTVLLLITLWVGLEIGDPKDLNLQVQSRVNLHFLVAIGSLVFAMLVHAVVLTYFMGTGRWMEDTSAAYSLGETWKDENHRLKYRTIPVLVGCMFLLILLGASGAAADPASPYSEGWNAAPLHFWAACIAVFLNTLGYGYEYRALVRNGEVVQGVLGEVKRIRQERGLPV